MIAGLLAAIHSDPISEASAAAIGITLNAWRNRIALSAIS
jgi:hypothetical protein